MKRRTPCPASSLSPMSVAATRASHLNSSMLWPLRLRIRSAHGLSRSMNGDWPITLRHRTSRRRDRPSPRPQARLDVTIHALAAQARNTRSVAVSTEQPPPAGPTRRRAYPKFRLELALRNPSNRSPRQRVTPVRILTRLFAFWDLAGGSNLWASPKQEITDRKPCTYCRKGRVPLRSTRQKRALDVRQSYVAQVDIVEKIGIVQKIGQLVFYLLEASFLCVKSSLEPAVSL